jgi:hypothetical protein
MARHANVQNTLECEKGRLIRNEEKEKRRSSRGTSVQIDLKIVFETAKRPVTKCNLDQSTFTGKR